MADGNWTTLAPLGSQMMRVALLDDDLAKSKGTVGF